MLRIPSRRASQAGVALLIFGLLSFPLQAQEPGSEAIVLTYHVVQSPSDTVFSISRESFQQQMQYLANTGYNVIPLADLVDYVEGRRDSLPPNAVVITIDDGWRCTYTEFYPELKRLNFPFTVFIYPKFIGRAKNHYAMSWAEVKEMADDGVDIQSHSYSHPFLTYRRNPRFSEEEYADWLHRELALSKKAIEKETGKEVRFLAYPYGDYDSRVARAVSKAGYDAGLTCNAGPVRKGSDPFRMRRISIYKDTSFATFRGHLGSAPLKVDVVTPSPGKLFDPKNPVVEAKIEHFDRLDPDTVGMSVLSIGQTAYSYDPENGSITTVIREPLAGNEQRVVIWGHERETGRRVEASWNFYMKSRPAPVTPPANSPAPAETVAATKAKSRVPPAASTQEPVVVARQRGQNHR
jgi:peptidoglycan/xylan/chitin deacetylase (PgdA/CDA1 family)